MLLRIIGRRVEDEKTTQNIEQPPSTIPPLSHPQDKTTPARSTHMGNTRSYPRALLLFFLPLTLHFTRLTRLPLCPKFLTSALIATGRRHRQTPSTVHLGPCCRPSGPLCPRSDSSGLVSYSICLSDVRLGPLNPVPTDEGWPPSASSGNV